MIAQIQAEKITEIWHDMRGYLLKPLLKSTSFDRFPIDTVLLSLINNERQAWVIYNDDVLAYFVTEISHYPGGKAVNLFLLGGKDMAVWQHELTACLFNYAKTVNARWLDTYSRRGFWKVLNGLDFKEDSTHYTIEL